MASLVSQSHTEEAGTAQHGHVDAGSYSIYASNFSLPCALKSKLRVKVVRLLVTRGIGAEEPRKVRNSYFARAEDFELVWVWVSKWGCYVARTFAKQFRRPAVFNFNSLPR